MNTIIENEHLLAEIAPRGGELIRLYDKAGKQELLWSGDPSFWGYHSPVLFPFVGKHFGGAYRYRGKSYEMGQHGFARTSEFALEKAEGARASFSLCANEATRSVYPFDFKLTVSYVLHGCDLTVSWQVHNPSSEEELFFQIGAHPAFRVPLKSGERKEDYFIAFHDDPQPSYILIDLEAGGAAAGKGHQLETQDGYLQIRPHLFDIDTFIFEDGQIRRVSLCTPDRKPYVTVSCEGYTHFGIWSPSDEAPFVCLEPWFGRLDDKDFDGELPQKVGVQRLAPGEDFRASYVISAVGCDK